MEQSLVARFAEVTEAAALAGYQWVGRGDKNAADGAAVAAMRECLNQLPMDAEIVIGEGEIDNAPMLYIGEKLGQGGSGVDIAVDPIEGTRMTAMGQSHAVAVLAAGKRGTLLKAPDMYMEKLVVGPQARGVIDLHKPLHENLIAVAKAKAKPLSELTVITLAKPRHEGLIRELHALGVKVFAIPDGDVAASILTCQSHSEVDVMYCVGGAPEGVVSAAAIRALGGDMQARLLPRDQVKGASQENIAIAKSECQRCQEQQVEVNAVLMLDQLASSDQVVFAATGITDGDLLAGVKVQGEQISCETLLVDGLSKRIRRIQSLYPRS
ncbi:class II fructose-bisphosphatase [Celerinatantimonas sp. MCCC 1A17872]|uniref:class II fructose-bisphosphatase n=1 Tax=Celerinatantimonas sp. MCCC 1A17872 TaxID=3177514 RepID=UPI0038C71B2D